MTGPVLTADIRLRRDAFELTAELSVADGEVQAVMGPNGAGKSTLLRSIAGLEPDVSGSVVVDGVDYLDDRRSLPIVDREVGMVFQDHLLFPHLDAVDNVAFGLRARGWSRSRSRREAADWLDRFGLGGLGSARPDQLSGGQAQRVALARALAIRPRVLLLDEPLAALDVSTRHEVRRDLRRYLVEFSGATLLVTHDPLDAFALAGRVLILADGAVSQSDTVAGIIEHPRSAFAADLLGVNLFWGRVEPDGVPGQRRTVRFPDGASIVAAEAVRGEVVDGDVFAMVRPSAVGVHASRPSGSARNVWEGTVEHLDVVAGRARVHVAARPPIIAEVTTAAVTELDLRVGRSVWVTVKATEVEVYGR